MHTPGNRPLVRIAIVILASLLLLAPATTILAAQSSDWYPSGYYLHGYTDLNSAVIAGSPSHQGASYSLTSNGSVWIGVNTDVSDYCPNGGSFVSDGWHWNWNKPNMYHEAKTSFMPSRTCVGHLYTANGGHNIRIDGGILDFNGNTDDH
jgi:hypothetical protein